MRMKIAREFWAYPVPPKHGAVSAYTHKELCPDPNPIHLREVLPDDIQDLDELEKELLDKLYHATREVDEVKYLLGHKIEALEKQNKIMRDALDKWVEKNSVGMPEK